MATILVQPPASAAPSSSEQRAFRRHTTFKRASVFPVAQLIGLTIHNSSEHGLMGEALIDLSLSQPIHFSEDGYGFQAGRICWIDGKRFGISRMSGDRLAGETPPIVTDPGFAGCTRRESRADAAIAGLLALSQPMLGAIVRNISEGGALVETMHPIPTGMSLLLAFDDGVAIHAHVRWHRDRKTGIRFVAPPSGFRPKRNLSTGIGFVAGMPVTDLG